MGFFTTRERAELGKSAEATVQARVRNSARRDFAPRQRAVEPDLAGHVGLLMQRVTESSVQEIDSLIAKLWHRREQVLDEIARVQREIIAFAQLSQSTMQSTKIISESLTHFVKVPYASMIGESDVSDVEVPDGRPDAEQRAGDAEEERQDSASAALAQQSEEERAAGVIHEAAIQPE